MSFSLEGKVAVITGGGQGVGFGIAQEFMDAGKCRLCPISQAQRPA